MTYAFGPFVLDPAERRLTRDGEAIEIGARYLDALALLASEGGRLVTKDRFMDEVWRGVPVTDEALTQCIRALRKALGDDAAAPTMIETVPKHGYRLIPPVENASAAPPAPAPLSQRGAAVAVIFAAAAGGGLAGMIGALGYLAAGLIGPGVGAASTLVVLLSLNLFLGGLAGAALGAGTELVGRGRTAWTIGAAALAGLVVGAFGGMIGTDVFALLFGRGPGAITGGREGFVVGMATGCATWLAERMNGRPFAARVAPAGILGLAAGGAIALAGGRLMIGSLASLAQRFPASRLDLSGLDELGRAAMVAATAVEAGLFCLFTVAAMIAARADAAGAPGPTRTGTPFDKRF